MADVVGQAEEKERRLNKSRKKLERKLVRFVLFFLALSRLPPSPPHARPLTVSITGRAIQKHMTTPVIDHVVRNWGKPRVPARSEHRLACWVVKHVPPPWAGLPQRWKPARKSKT